MHALVIICALIAALIAFDIAALLWGADSREGPENPEWERRRAWRAFH